MDYEYSPEIEKEIQEHSGGQGQAQVQAQDQERWSTNLQDLDIQDYPAGIPDDSNMYPDLTSGKPLVLAPAPQHVEEKADRCIVEESFIKRVSRSYLDIITDISKGDISMDTFTKESRIIAIGVLFIIFAILFILINRQ